MDVVGLSRGGGGLSMRLCGLMWVGVCRFPFVFVNVKS